MYVLLIYWLPLQILGKEADANIIALTPILALCEETGVDYEWLDTTDKDLKDKDILSKVHQPKNTPAILHLSKRLESVKLDDEAEQGKTTAEKEKLLLAEKEKVFAEGVQIFGTNAILRYLADKYHLEAWYPADVKERALCDLALDFHSNSFKPFVDDITSKPKASAEWDDKSADGQKWEKDLLPALDHIIRREHGVTLGSERCARAGGWGMGGGGGWVGVRG